MGILPLCYRCSRQVEQKSQDIIKMILVCSEKSTIIYENYLEYLNGVPYDVIRCTDKVRVADKKRIHDNFTTLCRIVKYDDD